MFNPEIFNSLSQYALKVNAINLSQGIPEGFLDKEISTLLTSMGINSWQYTDPKGETSLRNAVKNEYNNNCSIEQIIITSGATESLAIAVQAVKNLYGNKIAFIEPFYPYYSGLCQINNMEVFPIKMKYNDGTPNPDINLLEDFAKLGGKIFILNTPHNPSGWVLSQDELSKIIEIIDKYGIFLIVDDTYRRYIYKKDSADISMLLQIDNVIICGSSSKLLSATGLRIGWLLGKLNVIEDAFLHHLYTTFCQPLILQKIVTDMLCSLQTNQNIFINILNHYEEKRDTLFDQLTHIGFKCSKPSGGHFIMANYSQLSNYSSFDFARYLADKCKVLPMPGDIFYLSKNQPFVRFSFSISKDKLIRAAENLTSFFN
ncbi:MAG: pyridoxal phosphate-dependent aminotransferase [Neisseriaceae bacterium]